MVGATIDDRVDHVGGGRPLVSRLLLALALVLGTTYVVEALLPGDRPPTALAVRWSPWRAVAARVLWHGYLSERAG